MMLGSLSTDKLIDVDLNMLQDPQTECSQLVCVTNAHYHLKHAPIDVTPNPGPISESDFFTWEALICGPKDTPFVSKTPMGRGTKRTAIFHFLALTQIPLASWTPVRKAVYSRPS